MKGRNCMFWTRYQQICEERGEKPHAVLKKLSISSGSAANWKKGVIPNGEILQKIADYFDITTDYLLSNVEISINTKSKSSIFATLKALPQRWASLRKGDNVSNEDIIKITKYCNCEMAFLFNEDIPYKSIEEEYPIDNLKDTDTLHMILNIMDKCANNEMFRILQLQLSRIVLYHVCRVISEELLKDFKMIDTRKLSYIISGEKNKDSTLNYGFNFSDLSAILENFDNIPNYQFMFTGVRENIVDILERK